MGARPWAGGTDNPPNAGSSPRCRRGARSPPPPPARVPFPSDYISQHPSCRAASGLASPPPGAQNLARAAEPAGSCSPLWSPGRASRVAPRGLPGVVVQGMCVVGGDSPSQRAPRGARAPALLALSRSRSPGSPQRGGGGGSGGGGRRRRRPGVGGSDHVGRGGGGRAHHR